MGCSSALSTSAWATASPPGGCRVLVKFGRYIRGGLRKTLQGVCNPATRRQVEPHLLNFGDLLPPFVPPLRVVDVADGSYDADQLRGVLAHEVSHYWWNSKENWIDEGMAEFLRVSQGRRISLGDSAAAAFGVTLQGPELEAQR